MSTRKTKVPAIPEIGRSENEINAALKATKEAIEVGYGRRGDPLDRFVTVRDLKDAGLAGASSLRGGVKITAPAPPGGSGTPGAPIVTPGDPDFGEDDYTRPPAPTGVSVHHIAPSGLMVTWDPPNYHNHAYTEVFRLPEAGRTPDGTVLAPTFEISAGGFDPSKPENAENLHPDFAGRADGTIYTDADLPRLVADGDDPLDTALEPTTYYYWVRFVSTAGVPGPYAPLNGAAGQLSIDPAEVFGQLLTNITDTQTYADLIGSYFNTNSWNPILQAGGLTNYMALLDGELHDTIDEQLVRLIGASDNEDGSPTLIQYLNSVQGQANANSASLSNIQTWQAALSGAIGPLGGDDYAAAPVTTYDPSFYAGAGVYDRFVAYVDAGIPGGRLNIGDVMTMHSQGHSVLDQLDGKQFAVFGVGEYSGGGVYSVKLATTDGSAVPSSKVYIDDGSVTISIGAGSMGSGFVDFIASVYQNVFVSVDPETAIGQALQAVEASIGDTQTEVQQLSQSVARVDGTMESMWSVKMRQVTSSGLVAAAGFGLGLERIENDDGTFDTISTFLINADQFAIMGGAGSGAVITSATGAGGTVSVTLQTSAHGIKQDDDVVFSITDTTTQSETPNPLAGLAGKDGTAISVSGSTVKVKLTEGTFSGYGSGIGNLKNALMPAPNIPFIVDTERGVVGIRGKLVVDGLVRAKQGDFDELTAQSAFIQNLQAEVLNANVIIGQRIIAGTPGSGAMEPGDYDAISNFIVELNNPVTNDFPMRYWKPSTGQTAWSLDRLGNMVVGGNLSVGKNATVRTSGHTMFSLGGAGYDTNYALWIGDADNYGTVGEGRTKANGMLWVSDNGQAGLNVDTFLNSDPLVLPSTTGDIDVRAQRNGQKAAVYGSAMITLLDNLPDSQGHTILGAELWLVPASYQGDARTNKYPSAYRRQPIEYLNSHTHIYDNFSPYTWPTSGSKLMCYTGVDNYDHEQHINLQGGCLAEAGAWKLLVRVWAKDYANGHHNPYGCASAYLFAQQVHTPGGTGTSALRPPGGIDQEQNEWAGPPPTLDNASDYSIPPMSGHNGDTLFTNGMSMYWAAAAPPIDESTLVHKAGIETLTGRKTLQAGADVGTSLLPSSDNDVPLGSGTKRWSEAYATTFYGDLSGTAIEATRLNTARTIALGGDLSGSASFDGTANITITATIPGAGAANGLAQLDGTGKLDASQIPALSITDTFVVASQSAMLALTAQRGDVAIRTDESKTYILKAEPASTLGNWEYMPVPASPVVSVFGRTGNVTAASGDYTFAQIGSTPTTLSGYGITDAATSAQGALADSAVQPGDLGGMAYINDAPSDGTGYVRKDGAWAAESGGGAADIADFRPAVAWVFDGIDRGWPGIASGATVTFAAANNSTLSGALHWLATNSDSYIYSPAFSAISGAENYSVFIKLKASNPTAYQGQMYWTDDAGHGPGTTQQGTYSLRNTTDWQIVEIDMRQFTGGTYSWINSNVTQLRIDGPNYNGTWDIAWVAIGRPNTPPISSAKVTNIVVTSTTPTSDSSKSGTLYLVF